MNSAINKNIFITLRETSPLYKRHRLAFKGVRMQSTPIQVIILFSRAKVVSITGLQSWANHFSTYSSSCVFDLVIVVLIIPAIIANMIMIIIILIIIIIIIIILDSIDPFVDTYSYSFYLIEIPIPSLASIHSISVSQVYFYYRAYKSPQILLISWLCPSLNTSVGFLRMFAVFYPDQ